LVGLSSIIPCPFNPLFLLLLKLLADGFAEFSGLFILRVQFQNGLEFLQRFRVSLQSVVGQPEGGTDLVESRVGLQGFLAHFHRLGIFLFQEKGIRQILHDHRIFRVQGEGFPVGLDGFVELVFVPIGDPQLVEEQGAVILRIPLMGFQKGDDLVEFPALVEEGGFFGQAVE